MMSDKLRKLDHGTLTEDEGKELTEIMTSAAFTTCYMLEAFAERTNLVRDSVIEHYAKFFASLPGALSTADLDAEEEGPDA
jgi:hypothetical protein